MKNKGYEKIRTPVLHFLVFKPKGFIEQKFPIFLKEKNFAVRFFCPLEGNCEGECPLEGENDLPGLNHETGVGYS